MPDLPVLLLGAAALGLLGTLAWRLRSFAAYMRFVRAVQAGRLDEADGLYDSLLAQVPRLVENSPMLTQASLDVRLLGIPLPEERVRTFFRGLAERGRARRPQSPVFLRMEGNFLRQEGRLAEGLALVEEANRLAPSDSMNRQQLGWFHELSGDLDRAAAEYRAALELLPPTTLRLRRQRASLLRSLSQARSRQGHLAEAAAALEEALACDPDSPEGVFTRIALAGLQERLGRFDAASETLRHGLRQEAEGSGLVRQTLVTVLLRGGRHDEAEAELEKVEDGVPRRLARAELALARGQHELALEELQEAASLDPRNPTVQTALARYYERLGDDARAMVHLERAVEASSGENPLALLRDLVWQSPRERLADCYARLGRFADAEREYRRALKEGAANPTLKASLSAVLMHLERPAEAEGLLAEARTGLEDALRRAPGDPRLHQALGSLLLQRGASEEARQHLEQARDLGPADFFLWRDLGEAQFRAGRRDEARQSWERAVEAATRPDLAETVRERLRDV